MNLMAKYGRSGGIQTHDPFTPSGDNTGVKVGFLRVTAALNLAKVLPNCCQSGGLFNFVCLIANPPAKPATMTWVFD